MKQYSWLLVSALLVFAAVARGESAEAVADDDSAADEYGDDSERALLIVRKSVKDVVVVQGRNVTVSIDIHNAGASTASKVSIEDSLPDGARLLEGSLTITFDRISVGSSVHHQYVITFTAGGSLVALPVASVKYTADDSKNQQTGYSSLQHVFVRTPVQQILQHGLKAGSYASLGFLKTGTDWRNLAIIVFIVGSALGINYGVKAAGVANVSRKRSKALESLEKNE